MKKLTMVVALAFFVAMSVYACKDNPEDTTPTNNDGDIEISDTEQTEDIEQTENVSEILDETTEKEVMDGTEVSEQTDHAETLDEEQTTTDGDEVTEEDSSEEDPCAQCDPDTQVCYGGVCRDLHAQCMGDDMCLPCQTCEQYVCTGDPCLEDGDIDTDPDVDTPTEWERPDLEIADEGFRFTSLVWVEPELVVNSPYGSMDLNDMLNQQLQQSIANGSLHMLFAPTTLELLNYPYEVSFGQGSKNDDGTYTIDQMVAFTLQQDDAHADDSHYFASIPADLYIPMQGMVIPLKEAQVYGKYSEDLNEITDGLIAGALPRSEAQNITVPYINMTLDQLLEMSRAAGYNVHEVTLSDGTAAWAFFYNYEARERVQFSR